MTFVLQESATSDFSPSSDGVTESIPEDAREDDADDEEDDQDDVDSVDSLDEGLGDISSENELSESPNSGIFHYKIHYNGEHRI